MNDNRLDNNIRVSIVSPAFIATTSLLIFMFSYLVSPHYYHKIMGENNYVFADLATLTLVISSYTGFVLGYIFFKKLPLVHFTVSRHLVTTTPTLFLIIPIMFGCVANAYSLVLMARNTPWLWTLWMVRGDLAKDLLDTEGALVQALPFLVGTVWWGWWRLNDFQRIKKSKLLVARIIILIATAFAVFTCLVKVARYDLMPLIFGLFIVFMINKIRELKDVPFSRIVFWAAGFAVLVVALFVSFALLRGITSFDDIVVNIFGYGPASYNRLAALLNHKMRFDYDGTGFYLSRFLTQVPLLQRFVDIAKLFELPSSHDVWTSEFSSVAAAGLDPSYIWVSSFGYIFLDIGWWTPLYFFFIGAFVAPIWRLMIRGSAFGVVLYPWVAFSIFFWFGSHILVYPQLVTFVGLGVFLSFYEAGIRPAINK